MFLERDAAFGEEGVGYTTLGFADGIAFSVGCGFWEAQTEDDDEDWWACTEPKEGTPAVGCRIDKATGESCGEEIAERVALL